MLANDLSNAYPGRLKLSGSVELTPEHLQVLNTVDDFMCVAIVRVQKPMTRLNSEGDIIVDWVLAANDVELVLSKDVHERVYEEYPWLRSEQERLPFPTRDVEEGAA